MILQVKTEYGIVEGVHGNNAAIAVFKGIPYAAPPVGPLRFMPPQRPAKWEGVRKCDTFSPISLQAGNPLNTIFGQFFVKEFYPFAEPQSEDSLYLNVWTAAKDPDEKRPVMMWIHGGGLSAGYGHEMEFDGEALAKKGVVLVTINYRLGPVGFFAHPALSAKNPTGTSGNNVFLDQIMALTWIKENIAGFGGDPDNVTVFGQSGGAGATRVMLTSPLTKDLMHKAIIQSGTSGLDTGASIFGKSGMDDAEQFGQDLLDVMGMKLEDLMAVPADKLIETFSAATAKMRERMPGELADGYVLPMTTRRAAATGQLKNVPIMTGFVGGDGQMVFGPQDPNEDPNVKLAKKYFGDTDLMRAFMAAYPPAQYPDLYRYMEQPALIWQIATFGLKRVAYGQSAPYSYLFDPFFPSGDEFNFVGDGTPYHSSELWFMFGTLHRCWRDFDGRYYDLQEKMLQYWSNFAKTGNPNGYNLPVWKPNGVDGVQVMRLNENFVGTELHAEKELMMLLNFVREHDCP